MFNPTRTALLLLAPLALFAACSSATTDVVVAVEEQDGAQLYKSQACAKCHGSDGSSAFWLPGPDLRAHLGSWTPDTLAAYLGDPMAVAEGIERLAGDGKMPEYSHLDEATRRRLAEYVLTLGDS
ncbi:MAG: mono/diheme cytochrome c family protein [Pseudohongiellaceae bacterium]|jgi:mono/diheme cytochrome c family protein